MWYDWCITARRKPGSGDAAVLPESLHTIEISFVRCQKGFGRVIANGSAIILSLTCIQSMFVLQKTELSDATAPPKRETKSKGEEKDGMGWDGMGWDGMGWDGMGWDGMGWRRLGELLLGDGASSCASMKFGSATQARTPKDACCCGPDLKLPNCTGYEGHYEQDTHVPQ
ncbi:hypothetical protein Q9966_015356 [Columba livia]|nr:hypothetical protein Q9966_015356 [Columba livia]